MKKKIIVTILAIILLVFTFILSVYSIIGIAKLDSVGRLKIPLVVRQKIWGWEATYGSGKAALILQSIIFLSYLILFSAIIFLITWIRRKIKEKNKI